MASGRREFKEPNLDKMTDEQLGRFLKENADIPASDFTDDTEFAKYLSFMSEAQRLFTHKTRATHGVQQYADEMMAAMEASAKLAEDSHAADLAEYMRLTAQAEAQKRTLRMAAEAKEAEHQRVLEQQRLAALAELARQETLRQERLAAEAKEFTRTVDTKRSTAYGLAAELAPFESRSAATGRMDSIDALVATARATSNTSALDSYVASMRTDLQRSKEEAEVNRRAQIERAEQLRVQAEVRAKREAAERQQREAQQAEAERARVQAALAEERQRQLDAQRIAEEKRVAALVQQKQTAMLETITQLSAFEPSLAEDRRTRVRELVAAANASNIGTLDTYARELGETLRQKQAEAAAALREAALAEERRIAAERAEKLAAEQRLAVEREEKAAQARRMQLEAIRAEQAALVERRNAPHREEDTEERTRAIHAAKELIRQLNVIEAREGAPKHRPTLSLYASNLFVVNEFVQQLRQELAAKAGEEKQAIRPSRAAFFNRDEVRDNMRAQANGRRDHINPLFPAPRVVGTTVSEAYLAEPTFSSTIAVKAK